ncbi:MAG: hypothetical protein KY455_05695 [Euryarchaeota archaeon]|nr:hypothetical protein [Euryarchaeota archaeon]
MRVKPGPAIALVTTILLSGCASPATDPEVSVPHPLEEPAEGRLDGRLWFPLSVPLLEEPTLAVDIPVEENGTRLEALLRKGVTPHVGLDRSLSSAMVRLVSPDGDVLREVMLSWDGAEEAMMEAENLPSGDYLLAATLYGASAGDQIGHYLDYEVAWLVDGKEI